MKKTLFLAAVFLTLAPLVHSAARADSGVACSTHEKIAALLTNKFHEGKTAMAVDSNTGQMVEIYVSKKGTYTIVVTNPDKTSCIFSEGDGYESINPVKEGDNT